MRCLGARFGAVVGSRAGWGTCAASFTPRSRSPLNPLSPLSAPACHGVAGFTPASRSGSFSGRRRPGRRAQVAQAADEEAGSEAAPPQAQPEAPLRVPGDPRQGYLRQGEEGEGELGAPGECSSLSQRRPGRRLRAGPWASGLLRSVAPFSLYQTEVAGLGGWGRWWYLLQVCLSMIVGTMVVDLRTPTPNSM